MQSIVVTIVAAGFCLRKNGIKNISQRIIYKFINHFKSLTVNRSAMPGENQTENHSLIRFKTITRTFTIPVSMSILSLRYNYVLRHYYWTPSSFWLHNQLKKSKTSDQLTKTTLSSFGKNELFE